VANITFTPAICKDEKSKFKGGVVLRLPDFDEKYRYLEESGFDLNDEGEIDTTGIMPKMRKMVAFTKDHYTKVDISHGKKKYKTFDDLSVDQRCHSILTEIARLFMTGFDLGEG